MPGIIAHLEFLVGSSQDVLDGDKRLLEEWEMYVVTSCFLFQGQCSHTTEDFAIP
jgi:hypothetical protein